MTVNGQDFYQFALQCAQQNDEIGRRNAVGRAYYGVYHDVCSKLQNCPDPATHAGVRDYLIRDSWLSGNEPFEKFKLISLGAILKGLHTQRKWADYNLDLDFTQADADAAMILAKNGMEKSQQMYELAFPVQAASDSEPAA